MAAWQPQPAKTLRRHSRNKVAVRVVRRRLWFFLVLSPLAGALLAATLFLTTEGRVKGDQWSSIGSWYLALIGIALPILQFLWRKPETLKAVTPDVIDSGVDFLASSQKEKWAAEQLARRFGDPWPLPVRWEVTGRAQATTAVWTHIRSGDTSNKSLPLSGSYEQIYDVFTSSYSPRRLVILGGSGSGKSMLLLKLVLDVLGKRRSHEPVPVLVSIAGWPPNIPLDDWLALQLCEEYAPMRVAIASADGTRSLARELVARGYVFPVLDGFDEMPAERRQEAINAIADTLTTGRQLVLASRTDEYEQAVSPRRLPNAAVVEIVPVTSDAAAAYLRQGSTNPDKWKEVAQHLSDSIDDSVVTTLRIPLMIWLARVTYDRPDARPTEILEKGRTWDAAELQKHLLGELISSVYSIPLAGYPRRTDKEIRKARRHLVSLAAFMSRRSTYSLDWRSLRDLLTPGMFALPSFIASVVVLAPLVAVLISSRIPHREDMVIALSAPVVLGVEFAFFWLSEMLFEPYEFRLGHEKMPAISGPVALLQRERSRAGRIAATLGIPAGILFTAALISFNRFALFVAGALLFFLVKSVLENEWALFVIARLMLSIAGFTPLRLLSFLAEARARGVVRQDGVVVQFRHASLQEYLQTNPEGDAILPRARQRAGPAGSQGGNSERSAVDH
jgi:hypothetical protein